MRATRVLPMGRFLSTLLSIQMSGWISRGGNSKRIAGGGNFIPGGVELFHPSGNTPESDIFLKNADYVYLYSAPKLDKKNLRLNACVGYLNQDNASGFFAYTPSFPQDCPYPDRAELRGFSGQCQDYILSLGSCRMPDGIPPISIYDYACRSYLDNINYKGCFNKHLADKDFLSHEWRVWIGSEIVDSRHDDLRLFDNRGLLVDEYSY